MPTLALALTLLVTAPPQDTEAVAFVGARILPVEGAELESGTLVVRDGKIEALLEGDAELPADARVVDAADKVIMPGLICTHSHIGGGWGADSSGPMQPDTRILDSINVRAASLQRAQAGGITTVNVMPGSGHLLSGQTLYLKLRDGRTVDDLLIETEDGSIAGGIKMANGTNSQKAPPFPGTRGKAAAIVRQKFIEASEYRNKLARAEGDAEKLPPRDLGLEALVEVLEGKRVVHHHTHRHDDILTVLRLADEFGFRVVLHHVSDGWKVADEIAAAGAPCSIILVDSPGGKLEARDVSFVTGKVMEEAGITVGFHTDDWINDSRLFLRSAGLAVRAGMSREGALRAMTLAGAEMLDLDHRTGSLAAGKDADFIVLDGDPLSVYTQVLETWVDGERVFDRADPEDRLWAVGGWGAGMDSGDLGPCCREIGG